MSLHDQADRMRQRLREMAPELASVIRTHGATFEELLTAVDELGTIDAVLVAWEASGALLPLVNFDPHRARYAAVRLYRLVTGEPDNGA